MTYDPTRGNENVADIGSIEPFASPEQIRDVMQQFLVWFGQREPVVAGTDPFLKFATMSRLVSLNLVTEAQILGDDTPTTQDEIPVIEPDKVVIYARDMHPSVTDGCDPLTVIEVSPDKPNLQVLEFDVGQSAQFAVIMPPAWPGNTFQLRLYTSHGDATAFNMTWLFEAHSATDDEELTPDFTPGIVIADTGGTTNDLYISPDSTPVLITAADNAKAGDLVLCRLTRIASDSGELDVKARLHAVRFSLGAVPAEFPPVAPTPYAAALLLHFDGNFDDSSVNAHTVTSHGSIATDPSGYFDEAMEGNGSGGHYLSIGDSPVFVFDGSEEWSIDFWIYIPTAATLATYGTVIGKWTTVTSNRLQFIVALKSDRKIYLVSGNGTAFVGESPAPNAAIPLDTWTHIAVFYREPTLLTYALEAAINGAVSTVSAGAGGLGWSDTTAPITIGDVEYGGNALASGVKIDELRVKVGTGTLDYDGSNFTPPTSKYA